MARIKWLIAWLLINFFFRVILGLKVKRSKLVPKKSGVIIAPNHVSSWDPPIIGAAVPREVYFLAKEELFEVNPIFTFIIRLFNALPIRRETGGIGAIKTAIDLIRRGDAVVIFPEGTRNRTDSPLLPLKEGASLIAFKTGAPVVPVYIWGSRGSPFKWFLRMSKLEVRFAEPLYPENYPEGKEGVRKLTKDLEKSLLSLRKEMEPLEKSAK